MGGSIVGETRKTIETQTGKPVITSKNATELHKVVIDLIDDMSKEK